MAVRIATTEKIPVAPGLLKEAKPSFQRKIKTLQAMHRVPEDLILNLDQASLSYVYCSASHTLREKRAKNVSLVGKGKTKKITGTNVHGYNARSFLPMQRIYLSKTRHSFHKESRFQITLT